MFSSFRRCSHFNAIQKSPDLMHICWLSLMIKEEVSFFASVKGKSCQDKSFYLASKLNFCIDAFMYSIILLDQSINSCIILPISFPPCLPIQCPAILHSSILFFFFFYNLMYFYKGKYGCNLSPCQSLLRLALWNGLSRHSGCSSSPCILTGLSGVARNRERSRPGGMVDANQS